MGWIHRIAVACAFIVIVSCGGDRPVRVQDIEEGEPLEGNVDVLYFGGDTGEHGDEAVILDVKGDEYELEPMKPGEGYHLETDIPSGEALTKAQKFLEERSLYRIRLRRLIGDDESTIGYEVVPQPDYFRAPVPNVVNIYYRRGVGGKVKFNIRFLPLVERNQ